VTGDEPDAPSGEHFDEAFFFQGIQGAYEAWVILRRDLKPGSEFTRMERSLELKK